MKLTSPKFGAEELDLVAKCLESGWVTSGPMVREFEAAMRVRHTVDHAIAVTSCTAALHLAMIALDLGPGDEVIVPAFTWVTSAHAARYAGAEVRFVDVDPATFNLAPDELSAAVNGRTKAIVAVHLFGLSADMDAVRSVAQRHGLAVVEDAACAIGTTWQGRPVGALGDIGCFSFHPRKVVTTGEGGMLTTDRADIATTLASLRNHGASPNLEDAETPWGMARFDALGFNLRLSDIQAAVGVAQMRRLDGLLAHRRATADLYRQALTGLEDLALPNAGAADGHSYQSYVVRLREGGRSRRNAVMLALKARGMETRPGTHAVHRLGYYRDRYGLVADDFPKAALCEDTTITLPLFPDMVEGDVGTVADTLRTALANRSHA